GREHEALERHCAPQTKVRSVPLVSRARASRYTASETFVSISISAKMRLSMGRSAFLHAQVRGGSRRGGSKKSSGRLPSATGLGQHGDGELAGGSIPRGVGGGARHERRAAREVAP